MSPRGHYESHSNWERLPENWKEENVTSAFKWSKKEDYGN